MSCRNTRDFSKISVNKINNSRKSGYPEKKIPWNRHKKNKYRSLLADPPGIDISKISEDVKKKNYLAAFSAIAFGCKAVNKICIFFHWGMALGCGPGSRKHTPLPQSGLLVKRCSKYRQFRYTMAAAERTCMGAIN